MLSQKILPLLLVGIGSLQMVGYIAQSSQIRGIGQAFTASPLPLVFSHFRGLETFATDFSVDVTYRDGRTISKNIDSRVYSKLLGPYNRRNTFGAVFAFGAKLDGQDEQAMVQSVLRYGFCKNGPLVSELGFPGEVEHAVVHINSKANTDRFTLSLRCAT